MTAAIAFAGPRAIASGDLQTAALVAKAALDAGETAPVLIFDAVTSRPIDVDFRGDPAEVCARLAPVAAEAPGRGRPKLGVVAREITLLPRHWDWLATQPGGASMALRKLVEEARSNPKMLMRAARDSVYRFITATVGNAPGYEEAIRALYAGQREEFAAHIEAWPPDIRAKLEDMAAACF